MERHELAQAPGFAALCPGYGQLVPHPGQRERGASQSWIACGTSRWARLET